MIYVWQIFSLDYKGNITGIISSHFNEQSALDALEKLIEKDTARHFKIVKSELGTSDLML